MGNTSFFDVISSILVLICFVRLMVVNHHLRRENRELRDRLPRSPEKSADDFWKRYRDTSPKS